MIARRLLSGTNVMKKYVQFNLHHVLKLIFKNTAYNYEATDLIKLCIQDPVTCSLDLMLTPAKNT